MTSRIRIRTAMRGLIVTLAVWAVLVVLSEWHGASWPHRQVNPVTCFDRVTLQVDYANCKFLSAQFQWQNFLFIGLIVEFLWLKSFLMLSFTRVFEWLGVSLILGNMALSALSLYAMAVTIFPSWATDLSPLITIRALVSLALLFGIVQLLRVPDLEPWDGEAERRSGEERRADWCEEGV